MTTVANTATVTSVFVRRTPIFILVLCTTIMVFEGYDIYMYGVVVPGLLARQDWALTPAYAGAIGSAGIFGMLIGALAVGMLTDRFGRKAMFVGTISMFSIGMALCAVAPTPELLLASRVIVGLGSGGFLPTALAFVVESSPLQRRNFNIAIVGSGIAAGGAGAAFLGIWVMPTLGYQAMFLFGIIPLIALVPLVIAKLPQSISYLVLKGDIETARETIARHRLPIELQETVVPANEVTEGSGTSARKAFLSLLSRKYVGATLVFWIGTTFCGVLILGTNTWIPTIMLNAGFGLTSSLAFLVALNLGVVIGSLIASTFADKRGPKPLVIVGFLTSTVSLVLLALQPPFAVTYVLIALVGFGAGGTQNLINSYMAIYYRPFNRGTGVGTALAFGRLGGIVGPIYGGLVIASGASLAMNFYAFVIPALLALLTFAFGPRVTMKADRATVSG